jgi:hypothetical protein
MSYDHLAYRDMQFQRSHNSGVVCTSHRVTTLSDGVMMVKRATDTDFRRILCLLMQSAHGLLGLKERTTLGEHIICCNKAINSADKKQNLSPTNFA